MFSANTCLPIPLTFNSSSTFVKSPFFSLKAIIANAFLWPTPFKDAKTSSSAKLIDTNCTAGSVSDVGSVLAWTEVIVKQDNNAVASKVENSLLISHSFYSKNP